MATVRNRNSSAEPAQPRGPAYEPPTSVVECSPAELNNGARGIERQQLMRLSPEAASERDKDRWIFAAGDVSQLHRKVVAVVGSRKATSAGLRRAQQLGRDLAEAGVVVLSGLAEGIDTAALRAAIAAGGRVAAVVGTPIDKAYPAANKRLQEQIYRDHLLLSQFPVGTRVYPSNFPERNRLMAALSDATAIIEASDTSGSLHQAKECTLIGRWLFIARAVAEDKRLEWPASFLKYARAKTLSTVQDILKVI